MKPKTLILIVAAVGCGLAASYMTSKLIAERAKDQPVEEEKVKVVVAKQKIAMGTLVKNPDQFFQVKDFPAASAPKQALKSLDELKDKKLNKPLSTEQFVTSEDLLDGKNGDLAVVLPAGHRAFALRTNMEANAGGWVQPTSRVDLIVTVKRGDQDSWSRIFMQNMLVMAVDLFSHRDPDKPGIIPSVVTLAATPEQSEQLAMAQAMGDIRLVLRKFDEDKIETTPGARLPDVARPRNKPGADSSEGDGADGRQPGSVAKMDFPFDGPRPRPEAPDTKEPPPAAPKTHRLVIHNAENLTTAVYVIDETGAAVTRDVEKQEVIPPRPPKNGPGKEPGKPEKPPASPVPALDNRSGS